MDKKELIKKMNELFQQKNWQELEQVCSQGLKHFLDASIYYNRAISRVQLGSLEIAKGDLEKALELEPDQNNIRKLLEQINNQLGSTKHKDATGDIAAKPSLKKVNESQLLQQGIGDLEQLFVESPVKKQFGRYQIVEELGRGGMGKVYKAYDDSLGRHIALKVIISGDTAQKKEIDRFLREAKATAQLKHPNIISVYDIGVEEGSPYFTMDLIQGISLKEYLQNPSKDINKIIVFLIKIAQAIDYAHKQGIIHRDIKPANILVAKSDQKPIIMDFGLAKVVSENQLSKTGDVLGTPAYMPPEQAEGKKIDVTADVYSLGATLYEILTGRPPFQGQSYVNIVRQIVEEDPISPKVLNPDTSVELEAICLKSLEKSPVKRYLGAQEFSNDLQNFLDDQPIIAKPPTFVSKTIKWCYRHKMATLLLLLIAIFTLSTLWFYYKESHLTTNLKEKNEALLYTQNQRDKTLEENKKLLEEKQKSLIYASLETAKVRIKMAQYHTLTGDFHKAAREILAAHKILHNDEIGPHTPKRKKLLEQILLHLQFTILPHLPRVQKWYSFPVKNKRALYDNGSKYRQGDFLWNLKKLPQQNTLLKANWAILNVRHVSILAADGKFLIYKKGTNIIVYDMNLQKKLLLVINDKIANTSFVGNNFAYTDNTKIKVITIKKQQLLETPRVANIKIFALSPDSKWLVIAANDKLIFWDVYKQKKLEFSLPLVEGTIFFSKDSSLVGIGYRGGIDLWQKKLGSQKWQQKPTISLPGACLYPKISPDNNLLIFGDFKGKLFIYNLKQKTNYAVFAHKNQIDFAAFNKNERFFATVGYDRKKIILWDAFSYQKIFIISNQRHFVSMTFDDTNRYLLMVSNRNKSLYQKWLIEPYLSKVLTMEKRQQKWFLSLKKTLKWDIFERPITISSKNRFIAFPYANVISLWDIHKNSYYTIHSPKKGIIASMNTGMWFLQFSPDEKWLASGYRTNRFILTNTSNYKRFFVQIKSAIDSICFTPDSRFVVFVGTNYKLFFYNISKQTYTKVDMGKGKGIKWNGGIQVSPDSHWLALENRENKVEVWKLDIAKEKIKVKNKWLIDVDTNGKHTPLAWHPSSNQLAISSRDTNVVLAKRKANSLNKWEIIKKLAFTEQVKKISFSPDGKRLAICLTSKIIIYDLAYNIQVALLPKYFQRGASLSPDWKLLALPSLTGKVLLFDIQKDKQKLALPAKQFQSYFTKIISGNHSENQKLLTSRNHK